MYLLRPSHWFTRAGGGGGGGGRGGGGGGGRGGGGGGGRGGGGGGGGGGSGGGGAARGGSGSGGGAGGAGRVSPASGGTGTTLRSGGTNSGSTPRTVTTAARLGSSMRGPIWAKPSSSHYGGYRGSPFPLAGGYVLLFGFWPVVWLYDYPFGAIPTNNTRPGGPLITAAVTAPGVPNTTYIIYGDTQSVEDMLPSLAESCAAANTSTSFNISSNTTIQTYREESFVFMGVGLDVPGRNTTFESCLNDTIADNLLVLESKGPSAVGPVGAMWALVVMLCFSMIRM